MISKNTILKGVLTIATLAFLVGAVIDLGSFMSFGASTLTSNVVANVVVQGVCFITLNVPLVSFSTLSPTQNTLTLTNSILDSDNGGNAAATILIAGGTYAFGSWSGQGYWNGITLNSHSFSIQNTVYGASAGITYPLSFQNGNTLSNTLVSTTLTVAAPSVGSPLQSTAIYLGVGIPGGTPADTYTTNIMIENSC